MTGKDLQVSPAVEAYLTARVGAWRTLVRTGPYGGRSVPIPCEVCGKTRTYGISKLETLARTGRALPRFCSNQCQRKGLYRARLARAADPAWEAPDVPPAVGAYLDARLPDWRDRVQVGPYGGRSFPIPCEVCGRITYHQAGALTSLVLRGLPLPRFCSVPCSVQGRAAARQEAGA
jgi:hypothetical protein